MPRITCSALVVIAWVALFCPRSVTHAQSAGGTTPTATATMSDGQRAAGESLLRSGKASYDAGNYAEALRDFEQALARLGRPTIHYDIGQAAARMGDHSRALAAFREYLSALPNTPNRPEVERRIQLHERAISRPDAAADLSPSAAANTQAQAGAERPASQEAPDPNAHAHASTARGGGELWWLWAGIGAAVVGTVVAALLVTSSDDPTQPPLRGDVGGTIQTLEVR